MMHGREKSDPAIVAGKSANKGGRPSAEPMEPRAGAKGNTVECGTRRTPGRGSVSSGLDRVRQAARERKKEKFTALLHHVDVDLLRHAYRALKQEAAAGVDGVTWRADGEDLEPRRPGPEGPLIPSARLGQPLWRGRAAPRAARR